MALDKGNKMENIKISEAPVKTVDAITQIKVASEITDPAVKVETAVFNTVEKVPNTWHIIAGENDTIIAANNSTGRTFEGTMEEFNALLRG